MLSNTAVPYYYGKFRQKVKKKIIPVCKEISMEMNRIDHLIEHKGVYYSRNAVEKYINFCETELTLTNGTPLVLLDSFKLWAEQIFGWYIYIERLVPIQKKDGKVVYVRKMIKKRLTNKQFLIVGRGAAKTLYGETIQGYFLTCDSEPTHQITTAPTMKQAEEILSPLKTAIMKARGPIFQFLTEGSINNTTGNRMNRVKLASTKKGIENFMNGSLLEVRPMSIDKLQGLRTKVSTVDEWLSGDIREDCIGAIEQGASKLDDYIIIAMSSEGTVRNGAGDSVKMELSSILRGEYLAPNVSIWHYKLDDKKEMKDPNKWLKANPNIGYTVTADTYAQDVKRAEHVPSQANDILAKRFGIPTEGFTYFFTYEETIPQKRKREYFGMQCSLGGDLSQGDDFCAFDFMFPLSDGRFAVKVRSYITESTLGRLPIATRVKYNDFINEGSLIVMPGTILDMMDVYDDLDQHIIECEYDIRSFGYDPYNAQAFVERYKKEYGEFGVHKVIQGRKTESVPLGEIKALTEDGLLIFDQELMGFCMGNAITLEDVNGNRMLLKKRFDRKIDNVSALLDAFVAYKNSKDLYD